MIGRRLTGVLLGFPLAAVRLRRRALPHDGAGYLMPAHLLFFRGEPA